MVWNPRENRDTRQQQNTNRTETDCRWKHWKRKKKSARECFRHQHAFFSWLFISKVQQSTQYQSNISDLEYFSVTLLAHQWIICSEWVPSEWEFKQLINTSQVIHMTPGACTMMVAEQTQGYRISFELTKPNQSNPALLVPWSWSSTFSVNSGLILS